MSQIPFNIPVTTNEELPLLRMVIESQKLCGDGPMSKLCEEWFESEFDSSKCLLTPNCTQALEMAAVLIGIEPGDEVIMPSYTFVSTANAFVIRGAKIVFVDIRPDTMNIDETLIEPAITEKTKAIVPVHYAGVGCEMDLIMDIANRHNLFVVEDAAQGMMATYKNKALGTIGHIGAFSFHETKNYTSGGEGGLLIINDDSFKERAEIIREKGTDRSRFIQGLVDKYSWVDVGSSYLPSELQAAYLYPQLKIAEDINQYRLFIWELYQRLLAPLRESNYIEFQCIPDECAHNAHMFYIKVKDVDERAALISYLRERNIATAFHYVPLHSSAAGIKYGNLNGKDVYTTIESEKLLRLPMYYSLPKEGVKDVCNAIKAFFQGRF